MTNATEPFIAIVSSSPVGGRELTVTDKTGYALLWVELRQGSYTMGELTAIASNHGFHLTTPWGATFQGDMFFLSAFVRAA